MHYIFITKKLIINKSKKAHDLLIKHLLLLKKNFSNYRLTPKHLELNFAKKAFKKHLVTKSIIDSKTNKMIYIKKIKSQKYTKNNLTKVIM